jgi:aminoglycoside phosphotransferase (APT) family kinase protein
MGVSSQTTAPRPDGSERAVAIGARLAEVLGSDAQVSVRRLSGGASRETYVCEVPGGRRLILQCEHAGKPTGDPPGQAALLQAAMRAGVPVATVVAHGRDDPVLGVAWTLVEALGGTSDPLAILSAAEHSSAADLLDSIAAALAAVHGMPSDVSLAPQVQHPLAQLRALHDRLGEAHPVFELAFRSLGADRPAHRHTVVHGDFRMGNLMVDGSRVSGVLDWELTHIGDPVEDLGWLCVPAWRFTRHELPAAGLGTREQLLAAYRRHSGVAVPIEELGRWELIGTLRWGVICVMQAFTHLSGSRSSVEHAVIGRRACEVEWDLLELLDPGHAPADAPVLPGAPPLPGAQPAPAPALHDRPTAAELIDAARAALGEHVLPRLEGRPAFELRVSLRALGIVRRELESMAGDRRMHAGVLASLGVGDERELAERIRAGAFEERAPELLGGLRAITRAKLGVANPGYLRTYEKEREGT